MSEGVRTLDANLADEVLPLLDGYVHAPYSDLRGIERNAVLNLQRDSFRNALKAPDTVAFARWRGDQVVGIVVFAKLEFDTRLFGFPCFSLAHLVIASDNDQDTRRRLLTASLQDLRDQGAVFVSARTSALEAANMAVLQTKRFTYMDTTMRYAYNLIAAPPPEFESPVFLREARPEDEDSLVEIAATYTENRFHYDRRFPRSKADEMYRLWLRNSFRGDADWIVVAEIDGKPVGFTTNKDHPELSTESGGFAGEMIFSAVSPAARGRDVYTSMIHAGLVHFQGRTDLVFLGCLANNVAVQRAWQGLGFRVTSAACSFHRWLRRPARLA